MEGPLAGGIHFRFHVDGGAGRNADHMFDRVPFLGTGVEDRPHTVQMHRMGHHRFIDEFESDPFAVLAAVSVRRPPYLTSLSDQI